MNPTEPPHAPQARENADPTERTHPMPLLAAAVTLVMVLFGVGYLLFSEEFGAPEWGDRRTLADLSGSPPSNASSANTADGKLLFSTHCTACHQAKGEGLAGVFPPLDKSEWVTGDARVLSHILLFGVNGRLEVAGQTYQGSMPAFSRLSDAELAALASHIRASWSNQASAVNPNTVAQARKTVRSSPYGGGEELKALQQTLKTGTESKP